MTKPREGAPLPAPTRGRWRARFRALLPWEAPHRVTLALLLGLLVLGGVAFWQVCRMESVELQQMMEKDGRREEERYRTTVEQIARLELEQGATLEDLGDRLTDLAFLSPGIQAIWIIDARGEEIASSQELKDAEGNDCFQKLTVPPQVMDIEGGFDMEHPSNEMSNPDPMGCIKIPLPGGRGAVLMHTVRPWSAQSSVAAALIKRTAFRLAPVFLTFYVLLSALLFMASSAVRHWRERAEASARTQALKNLAVGLGHEIRNPLNTVALSFDYLARTAGDDEARRAIQLARKEADRIGETLENLVRYSAASGLQVAAGSVAAVVRGAVQREPERADVDLSGDAHAQVDADRMQIAFVEVLRFFGEVNPERPRVRIQLRDRRKRWTARIRGPAAALKHGAEKQLFDLFLRPSPHDIERGLALPRAVFQAHGGEMKARLKHGELTIDCGAPRAVAVEGVQ